MWLISALLIGLGVVVISAWILDIPMLQGIVPGWPTMKVNTASCLMLGGVSLTLMQATTLTRMRTWRCNLHLLSLLAIGLIIAIGTVTLLQYGTGLNLGVDQWLLPQPEPLGSTAPPGRMAPNTAFTFLLLGWALLLALYPATRSFSQVFALIAGHIGFIALLGYLYEATIFYGVGTATGMAVHTALGCLALSFGVLALFPERGWLGLLLGPYLGSVLLRRVLPLLILVQPLIWGFTDQLQLAGILDNANDAIIAINARQVITRFNHGAEQIFGYRAEEIVGQSLNRLIPERFHHSHRQHVRRYGQSGQAGRQMGGRRKFLAGARMAANFRRKLRFHSKRLEGKSC